MRCHRFFAFVGSTGFGLSLAASAWGQVPLQPRITPPDPPPAVATPAVQPDLTPRVVPVGPGPVVVAQPEIGPEALRMHIRATLVELVRLAREVEALEGETPVPPNAEELRLRALEQIREGWKEAMGKVVLLPEDERAAYEPATEVWENDVVTAAALLEAIDAIPLPKEEPEPAPAVVPTEVPLKTKTIQAVSAELPRPNAATFPAEWDGEFDETVDRYVFDEVIEVRDARGLLQIVPFRAEWAFDDGAWQLAFLRVNGEVALVREVQSAIPLGERPPLVVIDGLPEPDRVAVGARKAVSDLLGTYLGYRNFFATSRTWTMADGSKFRARLLSAAPGPKGVVAMLQPFDTPASPLPIVRLSPADQAFVVAWMSENAAPVPPGIALP